MSTLIKNIAKQYSNINVVKVTRSQAYGIILNNTVVGGTSLNSHPKGAMVTAQVLDQLGYPQLRTVAEVKGNLDDF